MEVVKDRVAIISNATDEVGAAISERLAHKGATVIISDSEPAKVEALVSRIQSQGGKAIGLVLDATDSAQVKASVSKVLSDFGKVDILVNNPDSAEGNKIEDISDALWHSSYEANMSPIFYFCRELLPVMCRNKHGRIINVGNLEYIGWPGKANYSAAKSALFGFTRSLALECAQDDVTVNCVAKGDIGTEGRSEAEIEKLTRQIPVKRLGTAEDLARAVGFFASDTSKYVTGQTFFVCGGKSAYFSMSI